MHFCKEPVRYAENPKISIVIVGKNEEKNIQQHIPKMTDLQGVTSVIYVDDHSSDASLSVLRQIATSKPKLQVFPSSKDHPGKKWALTEGINKSDTKNILLTDADCQPENKEWALKMGSALNNKQRMVLGYGPLEKEHGLVNLFSRFETVITAIQYLGYALYKIPYMGVGRNLAFTKDLFEEVNGYQDHMHIPSGDDDLFVQQAARKTTVGVCLNPKSFVYSKSMDNWSEYINQKKRHIAVSTSYPLVHKILLSIHPFLHLVSFALAIYLIFTGNHMLAFSVYMIRWIVLMLCGYSSYKKLDGQDLIWYYPLLDIMLVFYYFYFSLSAFNTKNATWN